MYKSSENTYTWKVVVDRNCVSVCMYLSFFSFHNGSSSFSAISYAFAVPSDPSFPFFLLILVKKNNEVLSDAKKKKN